MTESDYARIWPDAVQVRQYLDAFIEQSPELFPPEIEAGYWLTSFTRIAENARHTIASTANEPWDLHPTSQLCDELHDGNHQRG